MNNKRIKVTLYNRTYKEIDMSDFTCLPEELFANRDDIVEVVLPEGVKVISKSLCILSDLQHSRHLRLKAVLMEQ